MNREIIVVAHNIRSTHNVGSLFRTAEGLGVKKLILSGYTPYPKEDKDNRIPFLADKIDQQISKTALGAEKFINWQTTTELKDVLEKYKNENYQIIAVEQTKESIDLKNFRFEDKVVLIFGNEVKGLEAEILNLADSSVFIPMLGKKESFNVIQTAAMVIYKVRFL